ncbi:MAG: TonB-dependent receptor plug domain-containing protein [Flavitalea sp.]
MALQNLLAYKGVLRFLFPVLLLTQSGFAQERQLAFTLTDKNSGQPLMGATLISLDGLLRITSDSSGHVNIPAPVIARGEKLQVTMMGYKKAIIYSRSLTGQKEIRLDQDIKTLQEVVITNNNPIARVMDIQMGSEIITAAEARKLPALFGEVDIVKLLQLKPGVKNAGEGFSGFYVRGGGAGQNLILIDDVPVYNPNHLLGFFSVFNNDAIKDVKLYKAAYPAKYSGRLSSVLDVSTRAGSMDSMMISGGTGVLSSRLSIEAPIQKGHSSFIISGRRTYFDIFTSTLNRAKEKNAAYEKIPAYFFSDLNLRSDWKLNANNIMWATAYWGSDHFSSFTHDVAAKLNWGNRTASLNWKSILPSKVELTSSLFYSGYQYQLSNQSGYNNLQMRSGIQTIGMKLMIGGIKTRSLSWQAGVDGMLHKLDIGDFKSSSDLSGFHVGEKISGNEMGIFLNSEWNKWDWLAINGGMRVSGFYAAGKWNINPEPRVSARFSITENSSVKVSYTRMNQYLHLASLSSASLPVDSWYPSTEKTKPEYADQVSLGWSKAIDHNTFFLSMEGYYKWMNRQIEFRDGANLFGNPKLENDFVFGKGVAYGWETYIEKKSGRTTGWIGYTLSWTTRTFKDINDGQPFKPRYDRRHDLSLVFMHKLNKKLSVSGNWIYGSGAYITIPVGRYVFQNQAGRQVRSITPVYAERNNFQLPAVHRLDLSMVIALKSKKGSSDITISLYNAYSRRNPFYIQFDERNNKDGYITSIQPTLVSLFPLLPGVTYNFKF